jgi:hypothetical protein
MAHATVTVCVAAPPGQPVVDAVAQALAPFDMNVVADGRWDRWQIDGITTLPGLPVRAGADNDPRVLRISDPPDGWLPGRCDGAPRGLLDFEPDRATARRELETEWAEWYDIARHHPPARWRSSSAGTGPTRPATPSTPRAKTTAASPSCRPT